jgi:tetratricopeptide (TPR) repeat protein
MRYTPLELANAFIQTGELADALDALQQHLQTSPEDSDTRRLEIDVLMRLKRYEEALAAFHLLEPTPQDEITLSVIYERFNRITEAISAVETALSAQPENERWTERLIHLLRMNGELPKALQHLQTMPRTWRWLQWTGDVAAEAGEAQTAVASYTQALSLLDAHDETLSPKWSQPLKARILLARAGVYRRENRLEQAEADYKAAGELIPDDPMIAFAKGLIAQLRNDPQTAADLCTHAYHSANDRLREEMRHELESDVRYAELRRKVLE